MKVKIFLLAVLAYRKLKFDKNLVGITRKMLFTMSLNCLFPETRFLEITL